MDIGDVRRGLLIRRTASGGVEFFVIDVLIDGILSPISTLSIPIGRLLPAHNQSILI